MPVDLLYQTDSYLREFDARVDAPTDDPYGGVIAAQRAANQVVAELALFCADSVRAR